MAAVATTETKEVVEFAIEIEPEGFESIAELSKTPEGEAGEQKPGVPPGVTDPMGVPGPGEPIDVGYPEGMPLMDRGRP